MSEPGSPPPWPYYRWNAGRGYLWFADLSLYYVHGRWYSPYLARFISVEGYLEIRENGT